MKQKWQSLAWAGLMAAAFLAVPPNTQAQESAAATADSEPQYPLAVAVAGPKLMVVDLDLPGVWLAEQERTLMAAGSKLLRKPMNRPRCIVALTDGNALVGDSATREIYLVSGDAEPKPLTNGYLGIPMAMAVAPDGKTVYIGDAEKRAT
ncbi:MAG: hypothetical protein GY904_30320, partial [Planctomycetaceae bacterium]|nr:hypothetical protein [Planctomycetaceae bacterium]